MELDLAEIWASMSGLSQGIAVSLFLMGLATVGVAFERFLVLQRAKATSAAFLGKARSLLEDKDFESLLTLTKKPDFEKSPLARLVKYGLTMFEARKDEGVAVATEMATRELSRQLEGLATEARKGMGILATVGSTAPFVGLFGTVVGIITTFGAINEAGGAGIDVVSAGISEALIVTALGLIVAIVAVWIFNWLTAHFDKLDMSMQHASSELVDFLETASGEARS